MDFRMRDLAGMADMQECEAIQKEVWGFYELDVVPAGLFAVMHHYGAISIGAFVGERMAAFVSGFPGYGDGEAFHHSHMLAARPEFQGQGIGRALKWAQADRVVAQGLYRINWTFDPLMARNANLNLNHLGAVSSVYRLNVYGESQSPLHGGLPTDRLEPEWKLDRNGSRWRGGASWPRGRGSRSCPGQPGLAPARRPARERRSGGAGGGGGPAADPEDFGALLRRDLGLAMDWRLKSRAAFTDLFARGYEVRGIHRRGPEAAYRLRLTG